MYQRRAMRTVALAMRRLEGPVDAAKGWEAAQGESAATSLALVEASQLTLVCVVGIEDPLRISVQPAVADCRDAGVDVRMCTGDALETAVAIASQCGILRRGVDFIDDVVETGPDGKILPPRDDVVLKPKPDFAMTGAEFDERVHVLDTSKPNVMRRRYNRVTGEPDFGLAPPFLIDPDTGDKVLDRKAFDAVWPKLRVIARCLPEDKLAFVRGLRQSELFRRKVEVRELKREYGITVFPDFQVVAVTGDGTNDAPALKAADVGFAMGIAGTAIAKQACDVILMDDNFASIVAAAKWGRNVYESISKFIQFQLTVNVAAVVVASIGSFIFTTSPLTAVQMLWINMFMDSLASLAFATEPPVPEQLKRPPYGKRRPIVARTMAFNIFGQALLQIAMVFAILFNASWLPGNVEKFPPDDWASNTEAGGGTVHVKNDGSVHWTILFNTFVMLQLFNEFNSRKLQAVERLRTTWVEWNVFHGCTRNPVFLTIVILSFIIQIIVVQFTPKPIFKVVPLSAEQWLFCVALGAVAIPWQILINIVLVKTAPKDATG